MEAQIIKWEIIGFFVIFIVGAAWHFFYSSTGIQLIGLISPVNESVWEHTKMGTYPILIFSIIMGCNFRPQIPHFWAAQALAIYSVPIIMIGLFYIYTSFTGHHILAIDISIFAICLAFAQWLSYKFLTEQFNPVISSSFALGIIIVLILVTSYLTYFPPKVHLFLDATNGTYGINQVK